MFSGDFTKDAIPGIVVGMITRLGEISSCLLSDCDSFVMKVEKVLTSVAFVFGFSSPSLLIWQMLRTLLTSVFTSFTEVFMNHPVPETVIRVGLSFLEQYGLARIWDIVRDSAICMRFNNCRNDFLGQLNNIKIHVSNPTF